MKTSLLLCTGAFFLSFFITTVSTGHHSHCHCKCVCPDTNVQGNLTDPAVFGAVQLNIVKKLWNSTSPALTPKTIALKDILLKMANSDVPKYQFMSFLITIFGWSAAPHIALKPDLCAYAKAINQTVDWQTNRNCTALFESIDTLTSSVNDRAKMVAASAITSAGCGCRKVIPETNTCYKNGTVYKAKQLWALKGCEYPCALKKAALKLYCSKEPIDQLFGIIATSGLADSTSGFVVNFPGDMILQTFTSQLQPKLPKCCCKKFIEKTDLLVQNIYANSQSATAASKALYPECC